MKLGAQVRYHEQHGVSHTANATHAFIEEERHDKISTARNATEAIIEDIANATTEKNTSKLMRALAITGKTLKWSDLQFLELYRKRLDPKVKNYTALVWWHIKIRTNRHVTHGKDH